MRTCHQPTPYLTQVYTDGGINGVGENYPSVILEERGLGDVRRGKRRRETKEDLERGEGLRGFEGVEDNFLKYQMRKMR